MTTASLPRRGPICLLLAAAWAQQPPSAILKVSGDVPTALTLTADNLAHMPRETAVLTNEHDGSQSTYEGVLLREILKKAGAPFGHDLRGKALASYIVAKAGDGYQVLFTPAELDADFANERILVVDKRGGQPLSEHEGPLRLVVDGDKRPARSVRMLQEIQLVQVAK
jgi:DMSO/TMAO reductase YedYZ molybdopterin-dependent catalytic subunit